MEYTLKLALAYAKRSYEKYGSCNYGCINDLWIEAKVLYNLREEDEKEMFYKSMIKWCKDYCYNLREN